MLDLKAHARAHRILLHDFNPRWSLGVMDTRLSANTTSARVSILRDAEQYTVCGKRPFPKSQSSMGARTYIGPHQAAWFWGWAGKLLTVLAYNRLAAGGKNSSCLLPSTTLHTFPCIYLQNPKPKGLLLVCPCGFHIHDFSGHWELALLY